MAALRRAFQILGDPVVEGIQEEQLLLLRELQDLYRRKVQIHIAVAHSDRSTACGGSTGTEASYTTHNALSATETTAIGELSAPATSSGTSIGGNPSTFYTIKKGPQQSENQAELLQREEMTERLEAASHDTTRMQATFTMSKVIPSLPPSTTDAANEMVYRISGSQSSHQPSYWPCRRTQFQGHRLLKWGPGSTAESNVIRYLAMIDDNPACLNDVSTLPVNGWMNGRTTSPSINGIGVLTPIIVPCVLCTNHERHNLDRHRSIPTL